MASKQGIARSSLSYMGRYLERTGLYISFSHSMLREVMWKLQLATVEAFAPRELANQCWLIRLLIPGESAVKHWQAQSWVSIWLTAKSQSWLLKNNQRSLGFMVSEQYLSSSEISILDVFFHPENGRRTHGLFIKRKPEEFILKQASLSS